MKIFKRILSIFAVLSVVMVLVGCKNPTPTPQPQPEPTDNAPVIHGAVDKTIEKGTRFVPLNGITATDEEDGDITSSIQYKGNVNANVAGEYTATYTVYDSDGNKAEVTIKVTVTFTDSAAPMISGVADKVIVIGEEFNPLDGVSATDGVDGDLTNAMVVTGSVDVWTAGEYVLNYKSVDKSGNAAEATRKITVGLKNMAFAENCLEAVEYTNGKLEATVSSGAINTDLCSFGLARVTFKASSAEAAELTLSLTNGTCKGAVALTATETEYVVYFRVSAEFTDGTFKIEGPAAAVVTDVTLEFGSATDGEAPVITLPDNFNVVLPGSLTDTAALAKFIVNGVTAQDNIDGNVTAKLDVDFGSLVLGDLTTEETVTIFVVDAAGNRGELEVKVQFAKAHDTHIVTDPTFDTGTKDTDNWSLNGGSGNPTLEFVDGTMIHTIVTTHGGWDSASSPCLRFPQSTFREGNWYLLKFDAKATVERNMSVRIGLDTTEALGWIENFEGASNYPLNLTTEMATYYVLFYVHAETSQGGIGSVKLELKLGTFYWDGAKEINNPVTIDNLQFYLVSNENNAPEISAVANMPTAFGKGEAAPDLTGHITAYDVEDGANIEITSSMVDMSQVDMTKAGVYTVTFTVPDSTGKTSTYELDIEVLEAKDETKPVIALASGVNTTVDQNSAAIDLLTAVNVTDNVEGDIVVTKSMIQGSVDVTKAGTYVVVYTVYDRSGNVAELEVTFTVNDKEAPKFKGKETIGLELGKVVTVEDLLALVKVTDNVDGEMTITAANVTGYAAFLDANLTVVTLGTHTLTFTVTDAAGNVGTFEIEVIVAEKSGTEIVTDQKIYDMIEAETAIDSGSATMATVTYENGVATIAITDIGGWASAVKTKVALGDLEYGETYRIVFTAKADAARTVEFCVGQALWQDPWFNKFSPFTDATAGVIELGTEYKTYTIDFTYDQELADGGPTMEFRYGLVDSSCAAGNNIYVDALEIYSLKELVAPSAPEKAVNITLTGNTQDGGADYVFSDDYKSVTLQTIYTTTSKWGRFDFPKTTENYAKVVAVVKGTAGLKLLVKVDADGNPYDGKAGNKQYVTLTGGYDVIEWDLATLGMDATKLLKVVFYAYSADGSLTQANFTLEQLYYLPEVEVEEEKPEVPADVVNVAITGNNKDGYADYVFSADFLTVTLQTIYTAANKWGRFDFAKASESYAKAVATIKGTAGLKLGVKLDADGNPYDTKAGNKQYITLTGESDVIEWDLEALGMDSKTLLKLVFYAYDTEGALTEASFTLEGLYYVPAVEEEETPEVPADAVNVTITGNNKDGYADYLFSSDFMTVTLQTIYTASNKWGRFDFAKASESYAKAIATFKGTAGLKLCVKLDADGNPYDQKSGNKQYITLTGGSDVVEWDLEALGMDSKTLLKLVFYAFDSEGALTEAQFTLEGLQYVPAVEEEETPATQDYSVVVNNMAQDADGSYYTFSSDMLTVTSNKHTTSLGKWGRWNFNATTEKYKYAKLVIKGGSAMKLQVKIDGDGNPYDAYAGNKTTKVLTEGEDIVIIYNLEEMNIDSSKINKVVFWACDPEGSTTGSFTFVSLTFTDVDPTPAQ